MPCRYYSPEEEREMVQLELDKITRIACAMGALLKNNDLLDRLPKYARAWYEKHLEIDAQRRAAEAEAKHREKLRKDALSKLTDEERQVLGVRL